jgi:diamine N-acetyltransferase
MTIDYRAAERDDAPAIAHVFQTSFVDTFGHLYRQEDLEDFLVTMTPDRFRAEIDDDRYLFRLAFDAAQLVGYIKLGPPQLPVDTPPDSIELSQLYVLKDWHGAGIAASLMDWAVATARARGAKHIQLSVYVDNHRARRFYERYGFHAVGRYDFMVGSHADEDIVLRHVVMQADE